MAKKLYAEKSFAEQVSIPTMVEMQATMVKDRYEHKENTRLINGFIINEILIN